MQAVRKNKERRRPEAHKDPEPLRIGPFRLSHGIPHSRRAKLPTCRKPNQHGADDGEKTQREAQVADKLDLFFIHPPSLIPPASPSSFFLPFRLVGPVVLNGPGRVAFARRPSPTSRASRTIGPIRPIRPILTPRYGRLAEASGSSPKPPYQPIACSLQPLSTFTFTFTKTPISCRLRRPPAPTGREELSEGRSPGKMQETRASPVRATQKSKIQNLHPPATRNQLPAT